MVYIVLVLIKLSLTFTWLGWSLIFKSFHTVRRLKVIPVGKAMHIGRVKMYTALVKFLGTQMLRDIVYELNMYPPVPNKTPTGITEKMSTIAIVMLCISLMYLVR